MNSSDLYDVLVIGAGHAGTEAALAAARLGARTLLMTMNIFTIGQMSCNPAIGGIAKGQLVRELDALGGEMGLAIDDTGIQFRMLNQSKGPAMWSPRAQADRAQYALRLRYACEQQENLEIRQDTATGVVTRHGRVTGVRTMTGGIIPARSVILTAGTFLNGVIHIGLTNYAAGRAGEFAAKGMTESLLELGFETGRLKTGTPPRVNGRTIDFSKTEMQPGDVPPRPFSFRHEHLDVEQMPCFLTYSNAETHAILRTGLDRSPLYTGRIKGVGPRYCPSIEDKIVRFADKSRHQIFLEPEGRQTTEYYVNGFATSLPEDVQIKAIHTVAGLENAQVTRLGYAVEYDYFPPTQLHAWLETKRVNHLFFAGQINGTTGYEEAAVQGFMAGVNAVLRIRGEEPFGLSRSEAYIGVLIDDLVTKGTIEPYRMFTSRAEYRLLLRQDNADLRLMPYGHRFGLIDDATYQNLQQKQRGISETMAALREIYVRPEEINDLLQEKGTPPISQNESLQKILRRPEMRLNDLRRFGRLELWEHLATPAGGEQLWQQIAEQVEIEVKYEGFITRERQAIARFERLEEKKMPANINYQVLTAISAEAREKLARLRPVSVGQASRISGVSPADISALLVYLRRGFPLQPPGDNEPDSVSRETIEEQETPAYVSVGA